MYSRKILKLLCMILFLGVALVVNINETEANTKVDLMKKKYEVINLSISNNEDATKVIQAALDRALTSKNSIKVVVPNGKFTIKKTLRIYKNTYLRLQPGTTFIRSHQNAMLANGKKEIPHLGYTGNSNIVIDGGVWILNDEKSNASGNAFSLAHAENIVIKNVTLKNVAKSHALDLCGVRYVEISGNKFLGYKDITPDKSRFYSEAIQIDMLKSEDSFPTFGPYDWTHTTNVSILNNYFGDSPTKGYQPWGRGVGSHTAAYGKQYSNLIIKQNIFDGMTREAVYAFGWKNTTIEKNEFKNSKRVAIEIYVPDIGKHTVTSNGKQMHKSEATGGFQIKLNKFSDTNWKNIRLIGRKTGYINGIQINHNQYVNISTKNLIDKNIYVKNLKINNRFYQIESGSYSTKTKAANVQTKINQNAKVFTNLKKETIGYVFQLKTGMFKTKAEVNRAASKFKRYSGYKGTIKKSGSKYYLISPNISGQKNIDAAYNKLKKATGWNLYKIMVKGNTTYKVMVGNYASKAEAEREYQVYRKYGLTKFAVKSYN